MKKLFFILSMLISLVATSQPGRVNYNRTRERWWLTMADSLAGIPNDTFAVAPLYQQFSWVATKNNLPYIWNTTTLRWEPISSSITNIFNNSITNTTVINQTDSSVTIEICTGAAACDTMTFATTINNISSTFPINDSTIVFCGTDTVTAITTCDTVRIPKQNFYTFQNGIQQVAPGIVEGGGTYIHPITGYDAGLNIVQYHAKTVQQAGYQFDNYSSWTNGGYIVSYLGLGPPTERLLGVNNVVRLGTHFWGDTARTAGQGGYLASPFRGMSGYFLGVNSRYAINQQQGFTLLDNIRSKSGGIFIHTQDTTNKHAVSIVGIPQQNSGSGSGIANKNFADGVVAFFNNDKTVQLPGYDSTKADQVFNKILGVDKSGNVVTTPLPSSSHVTIIDDSTIQICSLNGCDTFIVHNVQGPITNITIINDTTLQVCGSSILSSELVINGGFVGNANNWELGSLWNYVSNNIVHSFGSTQSVAQPGGLIPGATYKVQADIGGASGTVALKLDAGTSQIYNAGAGTVSFTGTWANANNYKIVITPSNDFDGSITNVSVKEVLPNCDTLQIVPTFFPDTVRIYVVTPLHALNDSTFYMTQAGYGNNVNKIAVDSGWISTAEYDSITHKVDSLYYHTSTLGIDSFLYDNGFTQGNFWYANYINPNELVAGCQVVYSGTARIYNTTNCLYRINGVWLDALPTQITIPASDVTNPRVDLFYVDSSGNYGLLPGTPANPALTPTSDPAWQLPVTTVTSPANGVPAMDTVIIFNENVSGEWIPVTNTGTTTNPNNNLGGTVWVGTKSLQITNWRNGNNVIFTFGGNFNIAPFTAIAGFIKLRQTLPNAANVRVQWYNGVNTVGNPVNISLTKNNLTTYQAWQIPMTAFALPTNIVTAVHLQYTSNNNVVNLGAYADDIYLQSGLNVVQNNSNALINVFRHPGTDSVYGTYQDNSVSFQFIDSIGSGGSGGAVAFNGLSNAVTGIDSVQLGGPLTKNDTLDASSHLLLIQGTNSPVEITTTSASTSDNALKIIANGLIGNGILVITDLGSPITAQSQSTAGVFIVNNSGSTPLDVIQLERLTTGTASDGIGVNLSFSAPTFSPALVRENGHLYSIWSSASDATRISEFGIVGWDTTAENTLLKLSGNGAAALPQYGSGNFTGTPTFSLSVDASGNIIETASGGGGSSLANFYLKDSSLSSDRTVDLNEHIFTVAYDAIPWLNLDPSGNTQLYAWNTDSTNVQAAGIVEQANPTFAQIIVSAGYDVNGIDSTASIIGYADASQTKLNYLAGTHTFTGNVGIGISPSYLFEVNNGRTDDLIKIDTVDFLSFIKATDNTGNASTLFLDGNGVGNSVIFDLSADSQDTGIVEISGNAITKTITSTAANGHIFSGGLVLNYRSATTTDVITATDYYLDYNGTFTATLPQISSVAGRTFLVTNVGSGTVTVAAHSGDTINGIASITISTGTSRTIHSDSGTNWVIN